MIPFPDPDSERPVRQMIQTQTLAIKQFLAGVSEINPFYGQISKNRDYEGYIEIADPENGQIHRFYFRIWKISIGPRKLYVDSAGESKERGWHFATLKPEPAQRIKEESLVKNNIWTALLLSIKKFLARIDGHPKTELEEQQKIYNANRFRAENDYTLRCAVIEAVENHIAKEEKKP